MIAQERDVHHVAQILNIFINKVNKFIMGPLSELNTKASSLLNNGQYQETINFCNEVISGYNLQPIDINGFYMYRGYAYENLGQNKQAIADLKKCIELIDFSMNSNPMYAMLHEGTKNNVQKRLTNLLNKS